MVDLNIKLPDSFLQEEVRSGHLVTSQTKELWAVLLDLIQEFDRVCKKCKIHYFLDLGSMLGAVRHKGFIPWDEDVDISLLREDYDRLMEIGPKEFKYPYFLQNHRTDRHFDRPVARLRRSDTTFMQGDNIINRTKCNMGIFIDLYAYDSVSSGDPKEAELIHSRCEELWKSGVVLANPPKLFHGGQLPSTILQYIYYKVKCKSASKMFEDMERVAKGSSGGDLSEYVALLFTVTSPPYMCTRQDILRTIDVPFECLMVPIPEAYDKLLTQRYGDYMTPVKEDIVATGKLWFVDTNHSYKDVVNKKGFYSNICREVSIDLHRNWGSLPSNLSELVKIIWNSSSLNSRS